VDEPAGPVARECVEGYLFARSPLALLIFRRPPSRDRVWVPISGKVEPTDVDFAAALRRELREETGLASPVPLIDLDWQVKFRADHGEVWRLHAYGVEVAREFVPQLSEEHDAAEWVAPEEAARRLHYEDNRAAVARLLERLGAAPPRNA
jgi:8-oxo-dGTP pyrophosphatase MutT (NUDIX family)